MTWRVFFALWIMNIKHVTDNKENGWIENRRESILFFWSSAPHHGKMTFSWQQRGVCGWGVNRRATDPSLSRILPEPLLLLRRSVVMFHTPITIFQPKYEPARTELTKMKKSQKAFKKAPAPGQIEWTFTTPHPPPWSHPHRPPPTPFRFVMLTVKQKSHSSFLLERRWN